MTQVTFSHHPKENVSSSLWFGLCYRVVCPGAGVAEDEDKPHDWLPIFNLGRQNLHKRLNSHFPAPGNRASGPDISTKSVAVNHQPPIIIKQAQTGSDFLETGWFYYLSLVVDQSQMWPSCEELRAPHLVGCLKCTAVCRVESKILKILSFVDVAHIHIHIHIHIHQ